jgi:hypothetical protein
MEFDADFDIYVKYMVKAHPVETYELVLRRNNKVTAAEEKKVMEVLRRGMTLGQITKLYLLAVEEENVDDNSELTPGDLKKY